MDFSDALAALKQGKRIQREGWSERGVFAHYVPASPQEHIIQHAVLRYPECRVPHVPATVPWIPSQTDLFAEDWVILD